MQYLESYKEKVLVALQEYYKDEACPVSNTDQFKAAQALLALHQIGFNNADSFSELSTLITSPTQGAGLREFIVEFHSIIEYSKEAAKCSDTDKANLANLEYEIYQSVTDFLIIEKPTVKQKEDFEQNIKNKIMAMKHGRFSDLPSKVHARLTKLSSLFLKENMLTHPNLTKYLLDDSETFEDESAIAHNGIIDLDVTNADQLAIKLFHS